jgi:hypothetical protein
MRPMVGVTSASAAPRVRAPLAGQERRLSVPSCLGLSSPVCGGQPFLHLGRGQSSERNEGECMRATGATWYATKSSLCGVAKPRPLCHRGPSQTPPPDPGGTNTRELFCSALLASVSPTARAPRGRRSCMRSSVAIRVLPSCSLLRCVPSAKIQLSHSHCSDKRSKGASIPVPITKRHVRNLN